jgi:hypothetical protein
MPIISRHLAGYFGKYRREVMAGQHVHVDPEWETFTYGDLIGRSDPTRTRSRRETVPGRRPR